MFRTSNDIFFKCSFIWGVVITSIKEERTESGIYCIETNKSVDGVNLEEYSEHTDIAIFSLVNATDPASSNITGEEILRFLGVYRLDKEKSKKENFFAFKQKDTKLSYL